MGKLKSAKTKATKYQAIAQASKPTKTKATKECYKFHYHIDTIEKWYSTEMHRWTHHTTHGPAMVKIKWATDIVDALHQLEQDIGKIDKEYLTEDSNGFQTIRIARRDREPMRTEDISAKQYARRCNHEW